MENGLHFPPMFTKKNLSEIGVLDPKLYTTSTSN
jgi:hypothetical protein